MATAREPAEQEPEAPAPAEKPVVQVAVTERAARNRAAADSIQEAVHCPRNLDQGIPRVAECWQKQPAEVDPQPVATDNCQQRQAVVVTTAVHSESCYRLTTETGLPVAAPQVN